MTTRFYTNGGGWFIWPALYIDRNAYGCLIFSFNFLKLRFLIILL